MGIVRVLPDLESWLDDHSVSWGPFPDREYRDLVKRWSACFGPLVEAGRSACAGNRAIYSLESRLPADVILLSGLKMPRHANAGGLGAYAYRAVELRALSRDLANRLELVLVSDDFSWCCVFTHEAGAFGQEGLYQRDPK